MSAKNLDQPLPDNHTFDLDEFLGQNSGYSKTNLIKNFNEIFEKFRLFF